MPDIVNPYIAGNPVTGPEMFFGREDVFQFISQTLIGQHRDNVIVLYGQRRTGKTSVLYQMRSHVDGRYLCIFMDMHGFALDGLGGFLWDLANHITRVLRRDYQIQFSPLNRAEFMADPRSFFENEFLTKIRSSIGQWHVLFMLDEVDYLQEQVLSGKLEPEIFEYMRYLMQHHEWLNFLFSLGSGLEEMEKEYAFLFNVGLYKKISFLDRDSANDLITLPVKNNYQVGPDALERIYHITSGHPYYTQLLCHCLFNSWQRHSTSCIEARDVDEVLGEAVERGSAVLKYAWEELTVGEKVIVAGMAATMDRDNHAVGVKEIERVWRRYNVVIPESEMAKAIRSLIARDVIVGQETYAFAVDLQRLWVQKYRRIAWVKEEASSLSLDRRMPFSVPFSRAMHSSLVRFLAIGVCLLLLIGGSSRLFYNNYYLPSRQHASATATAQVFSTSIARIKATVITGIPTLQNPYSPYGGTLLLNAPLIQSTKNPVWDEGTSPNLGFCEFTEGAYHAEISQTNAFYYCSAESLTLSNFAYQVQVTIIKGDHGGISFRSPAGGSLYYFYIDTQGNYELDLNKDHNFMGAIVSGSSPAIKTGYNQSNLIAVVAEGSSFDLYVNLQHVAHATDTTFNSGQIGVIAVDNGHSTEVAFRNAEVWKL